MKRNKRIIAMLLSVVLLLGLLASGLSVAFASSYYTPTSSSVDNGGSGVKPGDPRNYYDIQNHWAKDALYNAIQNGIMQGTTSVTASPDSYITRAEMSALITRAFEATRSASVGSFIDVKNDAWYGPYVSRAVQMGVLSGNGNAMTPGGYISRQDAAVMFCRAYNLYGYTANIRNYSDYGQIASYAVNAMASCVGANVMQGSGGRLNPRANLTRAEFTQMMYRLVQHYINSGVPYAIGSTINGSVMVSVPNVSIANTTISTNLYLGDGVDTGTITLDSATVNGTVYVRGGSTLSLQNGARVKQVVVYSPSYAVTVETDGTSSIDTTVVDTAIDTVTLTGKVGNVNLNTAKVKLALKDATVNTLTANVVLPTIDVDSKSTVRTLTASSVANGGNITLAGKVGTFTFQADDMTINIDKDAKVDTVNMSSTESTVTVDGTVKDFNATKDSSGNSVTINTGAKVDKINLDSEKGNDFDIKGSDSVGDFVTNTPSTRQSLSIQAYSYSIGYGASGSRFTFESGTAIQKMSVAGQNVSATVDTGASIDMITVTGSGFKLDGKGTVKEVVLSPGATGATISTPNTKVTNNSGSDAMVGGVILPSGFDMTTDANGNGSKIPGLEDLQATPSDMTAVYPVNAFPSDFDAVNGSAYTLSDFGNGMGFSRVGNKVTGTFNYFENFTPLGSNGYFIPLALQLSSRQDGFTVRIGSKLYTKADLCTGTHYRGYLVVFIPLDPAAVDENGNKTITVTYDADGAGTEYKATDFVIDYSSAGFAAYTEFSLRAQYIKAAPSIGNAPAARIRASLVVSNKEMNVDFGGQDFIKTANPDGAQGIWVGPTIVGPMDAVSASYTVTFNGATNTYDAKLSNTTLAGRTYPCFSHYEDISVARSAVITVTWKDPVGKQLGDIETYNLDYSHVTLEGEDPIEDPTPDPVPGDDVIVSAVTINFMMQSDLETMGAPYSSMKIEAFGGLGAYGGSYGAAAISGTFKQVVVNGKSGYYAPISIMVENPRGAYEIKTNTGVSLGKMDGTAMGGYLTHLCFIPLDYLGSAVKDFSIIIQPLSAGSELKPLTFAVDCSQAAVDGINYSLGLIPNTAGVVENADLYQSASALSITGTFHKVELGGVTGWFAPLQFMPIGDTDDIATEAKATVTCYVEGTAVLAKEFTRTDAGGWEIYAPLAVLTDEGKGEGYVCDRAVLSVNGETFSISAREGTVFEGLPETLKKPAGTQPSVPVITVGVSDDSIDFWGKSPVDMGTGLQVLVDAKDDHKLTLDGTATRISGYTGFNSTVVKEQEGVYFPLSVEGEPGTKFTVTNRSDGSKGGKTHTIGDDGVVDLVVWLSGAKADFTGTAADALGDNTFTIQVVGDSEVYVVDFATFIATAG